MARIFISHSSADNAAALALRDWLVARGWDDLFLDIDPHRGLVSGQRWLDRLQESAQRCKAVLFVLSRAWLASRYCTAEFWEARKQERPLFALVIDDTAVAWCERATISPTCATAAAAVSSQSSAPPAPANPPSTARGPRSRIG